MHLINEPDADDPIGMSVRHAVYEEPKRNKGLVRSVADGQGVCRVYIGEAILVQPLLDIVEQARIIGTHVHERLVNKYTNEPLLCPVIVQPRSGREGYITKLIFAKK